MWEKDSFLHPGGPGSSWRPGQSSDEVSGQDCSLTVTTEALQPYYKLPV